MRPGQKNVLVRITLRAVERTLTDAEVARIAASANNGLSWKEVWRGDAAGETAARLSLVEEVNGAYEALVRVTLAGKAVTLGRRAGNDVVVAHWPVDAFGACRRR